jgi:hypothetical protein
MKRKVHNFGHKQNRHRMTVAVENLWIAVEKFYALFRKN